MNPNSPEEIFRRFVPGEAVTYCVKLYDYFGFEFKIKKARLTKFGDYKYDRQNHRHIITINNDLNPFAFLVTYLHEVAHLVTYQEYKNKVQPHGTEWKTNFQKVAKPVLKESVFPKAVLESLKRYLNNPKASSCSDPHLFQVLKLFDEENGKILLKTLKPQDEFLFNSKRYKHLEKRRTRIVCLNLENGRKYLINQLAEVELV